MRVAVVTGGTRGIGAEIATELKAAGYTVGVTYLGNATSAEEFAAKTGVKAFKCDASDYASCEAGIAEIVKTLGPVDVLVNNAGITRDSFLHKMTAQQWREVMATNLDSLFNMCRPVIEGMRERNFGRIINISSINGLSGCIGQTNYSAAKAGIIGFTKALALEGASKGITVNVVAPGYTDTEMVRAVPPEVLEKIVAKIPVRRLGTVNEIARTVLFLASDDAGFITGETISVNGGQYMA